ncbi:MAG: chromosomal replication initiator protein DnaA [Firmicutes bacterium]|nr:chromosomal replication initiator protein DnaA [Bacillota bacterium]
MGEAELIQTQTAESLWQNCFVIFESFVDKSTFEMIIKNISPVPVNGETFELQVQRPWQKDKLEKYLEALTNVYCDKVGKQIKFKLTVGKNGHKDNHVTTPHEEIPKKAPIEKKQMDYRKNKEIKLDPNYLFDNFVVGNGNSMAAAAANAVANSPATAYNPLFIYGGAGLGKTHLLNAIGNRVLKNDENARIVYVSSENFMNDFVESIQNKKMQQFRRKYRYSDLFLIDDIQFIKNREQMQEEFFHTFNELHGAKSQIVITSDRPPKDIPTLEDRLRSRFEMGLIVDIQPPELETRMAILRKKADSMKIKISNEVITYIAEHVTSNIRELEGALNKIVLHTSLTGREVDMDLCAEALQGVFADSKPRNLTISTIQERVCEYFDIGTDELLGSCRESKLIIPRHLAIYLSRELLGASFPAIGKAFGGKHHTTILSAYNNINKNRKNSSIKVDLENIRNLLKKSGG